MNKVKKYLLNLWYGLPFGMKAAGDEILGAGTSDGNDVTDNYDIKTVEGTLTVF